MTHLTQKNFQDFVKSNNKAIIDFWAPWCGPCRAFAPVFEDVESKKGEVCAFAKVNVDEAEELAFSFGVTTIPTILLFEKGVLVDRVSGFMTAENLIDFIGE